jgi:hypothetical protein
VPCQTEHPNLSFTESASESLTTGASSRHVGGVFVEIPERNALALFTVLLVTFHASFFFHE